MLIQARKEMITTTSYDAHHVHHRIAYSCTKCTLIKDKMKLKYLISKNGIVHRLCTFAVDLMENCCKAHRAHAC